MKAIALFTLLGLFLSLTHAQASEGSAKNMNSHTLTITSFVIRIVEAKGSYKVSFNDHAAFYSWPKTSPHTEQILKTLQESQKKKALLQVKVDAFTREILSVETAGHH